MSQIERQVPEPLTLKSSFSLDVRSPHLLTWNPRRLAKEEGVSVPRLRLQILPKPGELALAVQGLDGQC